MKIPLPALTAVLAVAFSLAQAQETSEVSPEGLAKPAKAPPAPVPAMASVESLKLAGFPMGVLKFEPAIAAAFLLTPDQAQELQKAMDETIVASKKEIASVEDKTQAQQLSQEARKDFESRRAALLSDEQISLLETIKATTRDSQVELQESKPAPGQPKPQFKDVFLRNLKVALNADQIARVEAAGGKLP